MRKFFIIILAFAAVLFLCCAEFPDIEFPSWEGEEISSSSESSSSSEPGSSSSAESSSSAISSSSEPGSSSSTESSSSAVSSSSEPGSSSSAESSSSAVPSSSSCDDECGGRCYDRATQFCSPADNLVYPLCGAFQYPTDTQFCYNSNKITSFCGNRTKDLDKYDPDRYECREAANPNGIYLKAGITDARDGNKHYDAVLIGTQTWMAENLNYAASGSKCYAEGVSGVSQDSINKNCATYGRLYNWATALANSASSSANPSGVKGVCPTGWHLPSDAEWTTLTDFVGGLSTAGTKLKAVSGWNTGSGYIAGTNNYGFSALPGGRGNSDGSFINVGNGGGWWSAMENNAGYAYGRGMDNYASVSSIDSDKTYLRSVRCAQD
jgi:uncharacterized protein (TIGR02145 family)